MTEGALATPVGIHGATGNQDATIYDGAASSSGKDGLKKTGVYNEGFVRNDFAMNDNVKATNNIVNATNDNVDSKQKAVERDSVKVKPLDGGWGWAIVFGVFLYHVCMSGIHKMYSK